MAYQTGGISVHGLKYNDSITSLTALLNIYSNSKIINPCEIQWESGFSCLVLKGI